MRCSFFIYVFLFFQVFYPKPGASQLHPDEVSDVFSFSGHQELIIRIQNIPLNLTIIDKNNRIILDVVIDRILFDPGYTLLVNDTINIHDQLEPEEKFDPENFKLPNGTYYRFIGLPDTLISDTLHIFHRSDIGLFHPGNGSFISDSFLNFQWRAPAFRLTHGQELLYRLSVFEILPDQLPSEAILYNPPLFRKNNLLSTLYFIDNREILKPGRVYAWKADAFVEGVCVASSGINEFIYDTSRSAHDDVLKNPDYEVYKYRLQNNLKNRVLVLKNKQSFFTKPRLPKNSINRAKALSNPYGPNNGKWININGVVNAEAYATNRKDSTFYATDRYVRFDLQSTVTIAQLPVNIYGLYSSDPFAYRQNTLSASVDLQQFKNNLFKSITAYEDYINRLEDKVDQESTPFQGTSDDLSAYRRLLNLRTNREYFKDYPESKLRGYQDQQMLKLNREMNNFQLPSKVDTLFGHYSGLPGAGSSMAELNHYLLINDPRVRRKIGDSLKIYDPEKYELFRDYQRFDAIYNRSGTIYGSSESYLQNHSYLTNLQKIILAFERFNIGRSYPYYSPLSLAGVPIDGLDMAILYRNKYLAFTHGRSFDYVNTYGSDASYIDRKITGGAFGFGAPDSTHIHVIFMYSDDVLGKGTNDTMLNHISLNKNYLLNLKGKYVFEQFIDLNAEISKSAYLDKFTSDTAASYPWLSKLGSSASAEEDNLAFHLDGLFNLPSIKTYVNASVYRVPNGYRSVFVPYLKKDNLFYHVTLTKQFFKDKLEVKAFVKNEHDNVGDWKDFTTYYNRMGVGISGKPVKDLTITINYSPYIQKNDAVEEIYKVKNKSSIVSGSIYYRKKIKKTLTNTHISISEQEIVTSQTQMNNTIISVNEMLIFKNNILLNIRSSHFFSDTLARNTYELDLQFILFKKLRNTLGIGYSKQHDFISAYNAIYGVSYPITKKSVLNIRYVRSFYEYETSKPGYNDFFIVCGLSLFLD